MENLRLLREKSKLTQREVAEALNITRSYYTMLENGQRRPSLMLTIKMASFFKVTVEELLGNIN